MYARQLAEALDVLDTVVAIDPSTITCAVHCNVGDQRRTTIKTRDHRRYMVAWLPDGVTEVHRV